MKKYASLKILILFRSTFLLSTIFSKGILAGIPRVTRFPMMSPCTCECLYLSVYVFCLPVYIGGMGVSLHICHTFITHSISKGYGQ